jgi:cell division protein ZapD
VILYEHPFNERVRTWLRLEYLFDRLRQLLARSDALDHHYALVTLFDLMEVTGRADLKSEVLQDLGRQKSYYVAFRGNPAVSDAALNGVLARLEQAFNALNAQRSKPGQELADNDWLMSVRRRVAVPAGACSFDLPAYHAWLQQPDNVRHDELLQWAEGFDPMAQAIALSLELLRESGQSQQVAAQGGQYIQMLAQDKNYQLLRLRIDPALDLIPEITAHRRAVSINLMRREADGKTHLARENVALELTLCA